MIKESTYNHLYVKKDYQPFQYELSLIYKKALSFCDINKNSSVLDIGCGYGELINHVAPSVEYSLGIDYSEPSIRIAKRGKGDFEIKEIGNIKLDRKYDYIFLLGVIGYLDDDEIVDLLELCFLYLKDNGRIIIRAKRPLNIVWYHFLQIIQRKKIHQLCRPLSKRKLRNLFDKSRINEYRFKLSNEFSSDKLKNFLLTSFFTLPCSRWIIIKKEDEYFKEKTDKETMKEYLKENFENAG